ncbi:ABC-2 type transport system permease protein [Nitrosomonas cryotolerans]|uniref:ABC-2 type transport system permease protein n=1 Tax=Nitrosomonas cryotolerans ATCC 49181 TaxID=1131553 RepID=A0A1N6J189_9PROT|nr:ABC transporter permease subunit [Nitrosomonas cryotolerans]SFP53781.1 ABC-2 type transport system permease protein [Nitrosomonas cryotolerans]SIO38022.1 ABC-2 type transport system permease protein [Nitrosomonas cryotolerans ATCC 49181]
MNILKVLDIMIITIAQKELSMLFSSLLAWFLLALMQLVLTWVFLNRLDAFLGVQSQLMQIANPPGVTEIIITPVFAMAALMLLMITPLLTMRLIAGEYQNHTMALLVSAPISMTDIVLGKFTGLMIFFLAVIVLVVGLSISLLAGGTLDFGLLLSSTVGLLLIAACFTALGLYISSLTTYPIIAAVGTLGVLLGLWILDIVAHDADSLIHQFSLLKHFENFNRGMIDSFSVAYLVLFIITFLILTIQRLDGERLHG